MRTLRISHVEEDAPLATALQMFLASHATGLNSQATGKSTDGKERAAAINDQLSGALVQVVLCSERSVQQPWLAFEAGSGWRQPGMIVITICHSGMQKAPEPFGLFQCLVAESDTFVDDLAKAISHATGQPTTLDAPGMQDAIGTALKRIRANTSDSPNELADDEELSARHITLLRQLATEPDSRMPLPWLSNAANLSQPDALVLMRHLTHRSLATELSRRTGVPRFRITEQGLTFLRDPEQSP